MSSASHEEMLELGRATGRASTRDGAEAIIRGLMDTVRYVREESGHDSQIAWSILAAIDGIRETMQRFDDSD